MWRALRTGIGPKRHWSFCWTLKGRGREIVVIRTPADMGPSGDRMLVYVVGILGLTEVITKCIKECEM
jgi:hypothetical protein